MSDKHFSFKEAISAGWRLTKDNIGLWLGYIGVLIVLGAVEAVLGRLSDSQLFRGVVGIGFKLAQWFFTMNAMGVALKLSRGHGASFGDFFSPRSNFLNYVGGSILYGLICAGGILLLVVPGIIWGLMFLFYGFLIVDKNLGPVASLKASARMTKGVKGDLFLFSLVLIGLNLLGLLCLVVGVFVTGAVAFFATVHVYDKLLHRSGGAV